MESQRIAVVGLGYVGLPLAVYLARHFPVVGYDINEQRISELARNVDRTREVTDAEFAAAQHLSFSTKLDDLKNCNFFIVTVPTPVDEALQPDMTALRKSSEALGRVIKKGDIVVFESTVFPGATEDICGAILAEKSGLEVNKDFCLGYSPERINPGDHDRRLPDIIKIVSGSNPEARARIEHVYSKIITAGLHLAPTIRVAEAAKVIENIQRDVNIALINELAMLFRKMGIETRDVLEAAGTKWNFHGYRPGLVGGHCIGVDPYYLTHKAQSIGYHPEMILAGRRINDGMAEWVAHDLIRGMLRRRLRVDEAKVLIAGFTFKENCPDIRNTKVVDLTRELGSFVGQLFVFDPLADREEVKHEYGLDVVNELPDGPFDAILVSVAHNQIREMGAKTFRARLRENGILYDLKNTFPPAYSDLRL